MSEFPRISIITSVLNEKEALKKTISVIESLTYPNFEYIVIDGGSTDGTAELVKKSPCINKYIIEKDEGIADAFNKGLNLATGEYINFQGAGDYYLNSNILQIMMKNIEIGNVEIICGQVLRTSISGEPLWVAPKVFKKKFNKKSLLLRMSLPHQGMFVHKRFFEKNGEFDKNVKYAMDYDLLLRAFHHFPNVVVKNEIVAVWRAGGVGTGNLHSILREYHALKVKNKVASKLILISIHYYNIIKSIIKLKLKYAF